MSYSIKEASQMLNLPATTLRYYDKEGLLPFVERKQSGYRVFSDNDIAMLQIIECLKKTGMSLKDIKQFSDWVLQGDLSLEQRYHMFLERKRIVEAQMEELKGALRLIDHKCRYYQAAVEAGTEKIHLAADNESESFHAPISLPV